jgi:hypothetical protein
MKWGGGAERAHWWNQPGSKKKKPPPEEGELWTALLGVGVSKNEKSP